MSFPEFLQHIAVITDGTAVVAASSLPHATVVHDVAYGAAIDAFLQGHNLHNERIDGSRIKVFYRDEETTTL